MRANQQIRKYVDSANFEVCTCVIVELHLRNCCALSLRPRLQCLTQPTGAGAIMATHESAEKTTSTNGMYRVLHELTSSC